MENNIEVPVTKEKIYTAVVYTDGSCGPGNPSFYGSGVHGYLYTEDDIKEKLNDVPNGYVTCTKGYVKIDLAKNLIKVLPSFYINGIYSYPTIGTNNMAECKAITTTLRKLLDSNYNIKHFMVKTDSTYAKGMFEKVIYEDIKKDDVLDKPNSDIWLIVIELVKECHERGIELEMIKVLGHSDVLGNILTDSLANVARHNSTQQKIGDFLSIIPNSKYWKPNIKKEPFLNVKSLFFTHSEREKNPNRYTIMNYNTDNEIGTNDNSALFGLLYTKEGLFKEIEEILDMDKKLVNYQYTLSELNIKTFYSQEHYVYKEAFGDMIYVPNKKENGYNIFDLNLTFSTFQGLAKVAYNRTLTLEKSYENYITFLAGDKTESEFIDITDMIYEINPKGKRVCKLDQKEKFLTYIYKHNNKDVKINLSLGTELIDRNTLKNIEKDIKHVYLEIDKKDKILQTNIIVATEDVIGVYTNFFTRNIII